MNPTTDDRPYFFNFSRWKNPFGSIKYLDEPTYVSQGNPFFILAQLTFSAGLALVLLMAPLYVFRRAGLRRKYLPTFLLYFSGLGLGFIMIEIALMQKLTLFLGHPLYSITITLLAILLFTGLGSLISRSWFDGDRRKGWTIPVVLTLYLTAFIGICPVMTRAWIDWPLAARAGVTVALLAVPFVLLGVPFAFGIRLLTRYNPTIVPWAWAVNGCLTVIGSILTVILSMNFGFNFVLLGGLPPRP